MAITITPTQLTLILPTNRASLNWLQHFNNDLPPAGIDTVNRVAAFLSQCAHESGDFIQLHENLNYRASSLIATWPSHFNATNAPQYEHKPDKIANLVYANRMGNGDEASGDGYKYRGRGPIQITGHDNYLAASQFIYGDDTLVNNPALIEIDMDAAIQSAIWFWNTHNLNALADNGDVLSITKKINGGTTGLADRIQRYNNALKVLSGA